MPMLDSNSRAPTFLLLGAAKCGTTSLAYYLSQHSDICFSEPKEPIFFEAQYERGLDYYWREYFQHWNGERAIGEGRPLNLYLPFVARRIRESLPEAKLVALLRDPVDRAYSHWWHRYSRGQEPLSFEAAIAEDRARIERGESFDGDAGERRWRAGLDPGGGSSRHRALLDLGFYAEQIERYRELFPDSQLRIVFYEDLVAGLPRVMRDLFTFVGVNPDASLGDLGVRNPRRAQMRSPAARRLLFAVRAAGLRNLVPRGLRAKLQGLMERPAKQPPLDPGIRRELVAYYEPHNDRLERLTGRNLSAWRGRRAA